MSKSFVMVVYDKPENQGFTRRIEWDGNSTPEIIEIGDDTFYKIGRLLEPGDRYEYRLTKPMVLLTDDEISEATWQARMAGDMEA